MLCFPNPSVNLAEHTKNYNGVADLVFNQRVYDLGSQQGLRKALNPEHTSI